MPFKLSNLFQVVCLKYSCLKAIQNRTKIIQQCIYITLEIEQNHTKNCQNVYLTFMHSNFQLLQIHYRNEINILDINTLLIFYQLTQIFQFLLILLPISQTYLNELKIINNIQKSPIQKCTLAPEKYSDLQEIQYINNPMKRQVYYLQVMDMFSAGNVLAEIFTGESLFSLEQLLQQEILQVLISQQFSSMYFSRFINTI
ncbi:unnamed protein product [Paramecium sonneborni]|uniref:Uncharacterized protein n=1 Tax=Paramecium sonneborni TaxID=65129 RepID=A0A8S1RHG6_9CILI|nr:unnamed protein product [Paramecium sonneborni]